MLLEEVAARIADAIQRSRAENIRRDYAANGDRPRLQSAPLLVDDLVTIVAAALQAVTGWAGEQPDLRDEFTQGQRAPGLAAAVRDLAQVPVTNLVIESCDQDHEDNRVMRDELGAAAPFRYTHDRPPRTPSYGSRMCMPGRRAAAAACAQRSPTASRRAGVENTRTPLALRGAFAVCGWARKAGNR